MPPTHTTIADLTAHRLHNQGLLGASFDTPEDVVRGNVAVQAQDYPGAKWSLGQRVNGVSDVDLDRLLDGGRILRTHVMRPTWHFVLPEDLPWLLALTAPRVHAANRARYRELELDDTTLERGREVVEREIADVGPRTRPELGDALAASGIDPAGQRLAYLVMYAELEAAIVSGPLRGKQHTYARFDDRVPPGRERDRDEALTELVVRYMRSHGPATPHDVAWWSGLTVTDARRGLEMAGDRLARSEIDGVTWWHDADLPDARLDAPTVHLLQPWDEYVVGFRNHQPVWIPEIRAMQSPKGALWNASLIAVDGVVRGGWRRKMSARDVRISLILPHELDAAHSAALDSEASRYGAFLGRPVTID